MFHTLCQRAGATGRLVTALVAGGALIAATAVLHAQQQYELYIVAVNEATDTPATDLSAPDILMTEAGEEGRVLGVEPFRRPVKLTILVDNGAGMGDGLAHYREGLRALIEALPADVEVGVIALAPNPRWLARPTTDRADLRRSVQLLVPDTFPGRFNDALVEYTMRLDRQFASEEADAEEPYTPVLVAFGSAGYDSSEPRRDELNRMMRSMIQYGVQTYFAVLSQHDLRGADALNTGTQALVAKAVQEMTGGVYEPLAVTSRVATLLPEWGARIARTHVLGTSQYRVQLERPADLTGPLVDLAVYVQREGYYGMVTADGRIP